MVLTPAGDGSHEHVCTEGEGANLYAENSEQNEASNVNDEGNKR